MKYIILIYDRDDWWETATEADVSRAMEAHGAFGVYLEARGGHVYGEALASTRNGASVRQAEPGGELVVTDGPFIDLKETLGGFYIIEATDLAEAVGVAKRCPADFGVEVRPLVEFADDGTADVSTPEGAVAS